DYYCQSSDSSLSAVLF
nr:immunoglobulin light chain junction region [Macaca mulatta]MOX69847.1 immunoglobulin light chain junction region [Macaca mulatta]MOX69868.1 immunoglobulin light chain junction region [Macaca mulatta]MOX69949.1 immunoglobulin light chain junction region [Macaca mulatta]MOX70335.1 immunoglobulin light chain junction region [Macaca mulatta]